MTTDDNQCPHMLNLGTWGWGLTLRCTLNRSHRGVHVGPIYANASVERHVLADDVTALEWRTSNIDGQPVTSSGGT